MLAKEEFIQRISTYIEGKQNEQVFVQDFVENLYTLLYDRPLERWTQGRKKELQKILKEEDNLGQELRVALPELYDFFDWIENDDFIKQHANINKHQIQKSLLQIFEEEKLAKNPEKFEATVKKVRKGFLSKMYEYLSHEDYIYFFKYTKIQVINTEEEQYKIIIRISQSKEEKAKGKQYKPYCMKKLDDVFMPLFNNALRKEIAVDKRFRKYGGYAFYETDIYQKRKEDIGEKKYTKFLQYEKNGSEETPHQGSLFAQEETKSDEPTSAPFFKHSGNEGAHKLLTQWLQNQRSIDKDDAPGVVLQGYESGKDQRLLIAHFIDQVQNKLPFFKIEIIDCEKFSKKCRALYDGENKEENVKAKRARVEKRMETILAANVFVLYNIEKLENKIYSQNMLLQKINQRGNSKLLITSNKKIIDFPIAKKMESGELERKGFLPEIIGKLKTLPTGTITSPKEEESGGLLYEMFKAKFPSIHLPKNLIFGIGKLIPDTTCYDALLQEIVAACEGGEVQFTIDMAKSIIQNRITAIYNPSLGEITDTIKKYFNEIPNDYNRTHAKKEKEIIKHIAYRAKRLPIPGSNNHYRTDEEIGNYLKITASTAKKYINEITNNSIHKKDIEEKILAMKLSRENMLLLGYD